MLTRSMPVSSSPAPVAWDLPQTGLSVFYGLPETSRLFHYFLPGAILQGKQVVCFDGANRFDPILLARFARERGQSLSEFGRRIRIARAFTCFQLTELLVRLPRLVRDFSASTVIVTALPDLYFDEDVRERDAIASFCQAQQALQVAERLAIPIAVFTDATFSRSPRRMLFQRLIAGASHIFQFTKQGNTDLAMICEKSTLPIRKAVV